MSSLLVFIVEFLASIAAAAKVRQQARAAEELPQGEKAVAAIDADVLAIRAEMAKLTEPPMPPSALTKPEQPVKLPN